MVSSGLGARTVARLAAVILCVGFLPVRLVSSKKAADPCAPLADSDSCKVKAKGLTLLCSGGLHEHIWGSSRVRVLILCRWPEDTFDPDYISAIFPKLHKLVVVDGNVTRLTADFPTSDLEVLTLSGLQLEKLSESSFSRLRSLHALDLRSNRLSQLDLGLLASPPLLDKVYLAENEWNCSADLTWLVANGANTSVARRVVDRDKLACFGAPYPGKPLVSVMAHVKALQAECPKEPPNNCSCWLSNIVWGDGHLVPVITVDCNRRGLRQLPDRLPANTTTLLAKGNQISSLRPLVSNVHYSRVSDIYLDDNDIKSVTELEGSDWMLNFRVLSLRKNHISELPTYAIDNALQQNSHAVNIFLGQNPWKCDCTFTPSFQDLLVKYLILVKDIYDIKCSYSEADKNSLVEIRGLSRSAICREPPVYVIQPWYLLNAVLSLLIILVIGKLCYDYWWFKRTGKLPWIVAKMP